MYESFGLPWPAVLLGFLLGAAAVVLHRRRILGRVPLALALLVPTVTVLAAAVPFRFSNGTVADADDVNANFDALAAQIEAIQAASTYRVDTPAPLPSGVGLSYETVQPRQFDPLCRDEDGCTMRICYQALSDTRFCSLWTLGLVANRWRAVGVDEVPVEGLDDNLLSTVAAETSGCGLTDADRDAPLTGSVDADPGFAIEYRENWQSCVVTFTD